jgi:glycerophosphoryl diester phosphodiesterase
VWTIDQSDEMRRLLDLGADAIMTDLPETLEGVLRERER